MRISAWSDDQPGRDRWMVQFYPPDRTGLARQDDEGHYWRRIPRRLDLDLSEGELREPRDTPAAAVQRELVHGTTAPELQQVAYEDGEIEGSAPPRPGPLDLGSPRRFTPNGSASYVNTP